MPKPRPLEWLEERWGARRLANRFLKEAVPAKGRWLYTLGSATFTAFVLQAVTGIAMLFFYEPSVDRAHESVVMLMNEVPAGWLIRGLHFWGASAMVLLLFLHLARVFFSAAYKFPRETTWLIGVGLFFVTLVQFYTGNLLGFHEFGYWSAVVGTYMAKYVPFIGQALYEVIVGGEFVGQATLSRFFALHVIAVPVTLAALASAHLLLVIKHGEFGIWVNYQEFQSGTPPEGTEHKRFTPDCAVESVTFFPHQALRDATTSAILLATLFALAFFARAPVFTKADPGNLDFIPRAQWAFLPHQRLLDFMPGTFLTALGSWVFIILVVASLASVPFLDRDAERNPFRRPAMTLLGIFVILVYGMLFVIETMQDPAITEQERGVAKPVSTEGAEERGR
jgi:ubiquinol-cytochrome c reductase cytochrome b subunit